MLTDVSEHPSQLKRPSGALCGPSSGKDNTTGPSNGKDNTTGASNRGYNTTRSLECPKDNQTKMDTPNILELERFHSEHQTEIKIPEQGQFKAGCLASFLPAWKDITDDPIVINSIQGMKVPLEGIPPLRPPSQAELSPSKPDPVIDAAIAEMLELGALKAIPTNSSVFCSRVFTVPKIERGVEYARRFILNLKVRNLASLDLRLYYRYDKPSFSAKYSLSFQLYFSLNNNVFSSCSHSTRSL